MLLPVSLELIIAVPALPHVVREQPVAVPKVETPAADDRTGPRWPLNSGRNAKATGPPFVPRHYFDHWPHIHPPERPK